MFGTSFGKKKFTRILIVDYKEYKIVGARCPFNSQYIYIYIFVLLLIPMVKGVYLRFS